MHESVLKAKSDTMGLGESGRNRLDTGGLGT